MTRRLALLALLVALLGAVWVRIAPSAAARWHVDPETATRNSRPNDFLLLPDGGDMRAPVYTLEAEELGARLAEVALGEPRTERLAGEDGALASFIQRSALFGFPDYISVKPIALPGGGTTLAIWSRSRFGYSDRGVNARRVRRWLRALEPLQEAG